MKSFKVEFTHPIVTARFKERVVFGAFFLLFTSMSLSLIWSYSFTPFVDEPSVMFSAVAYHKLNDLDWGFSEWYEVDSHSVSHFAFYQVMHLLLFVFSPIAASKILISLIVIAMPVAMLLFFKTIGKSKWLSLAGFALAFNYVLNMGYIPYFMGVPLWITTLYLIEQNNIAFKRWKVFLLSLIIVCSPYIHFLFSTCLIATYFYWTITTYSSRQSMIKALSVPLASLIVLYFINANGFTKIDLNALLNAYHRSPLLETLTNLSSIYLLTWTKNGLDTLSNALLLISVMTILVVKNTAKPELSESINPWQQIRRYKLEILILLFFIARICGPSWLSRPYSMYDIPSRLVIFIAVLFVSLPWYRERRLRDVAVFIPLLLFVFIHLYSLRDPFFQFGKKAQFLQDVSESLPVGSAVYPAYIHYDMNTNGKNKFKFGDFHRSINLHLPEWISVLRGGYHPFTFCNHLFHI